MVLTDQPRKILIVDDAPIVAESLALLLSREGLDVKVAHSAEDAVDLITKWAPDSAFVDIMLPGMNGIEFSGTLKERHPQCEIALMSGHPGAVNLLENARQEGRELAVLPKPFEPDRIIAIARGKESPAGSEPEQADRVEVPLGVEASTTDDSETEAKTERSDPESAPRDSTPPV